nr:glycosyltransferase family 2 protein [Algoriphagus limi]
MLTCFNRKEKTKVCLENLFAQELPENTKLSVFVCDDGSTDGTEEMLATAFPQVHVVKGNGKLFWGGGMRKAWNLAIEKQKNDFFLWLNDDTFLYEKALEDLFEDFTKLEKPGIISAACKRPGKDEISYGGLSNDGYILPNGSPQEVTYINGNLVLIPAIVVDEIGMISKSYTHYLGDYDYGLRAQKAGFSCYTTSTFLAECEINAIPYWGDPNQPLATRWKMAHDVKGLAIQEYIAFKKYHHGNLVGLKTWIDSYLKILFPHNYTRIRNFLKDN